MLSCTFGVIFGPRARRLSSEWSFSKSRCDPPTFFHFSYKYLYKEDPNRLVFMHLFPYLKYIEYYIIQSMLDEPHSLGVPTCPMISKPAKMAAHNQWATEHTTVYRKLRLIL